MTDAGAPRASVIIPNWNGLRYLRPCLDALAEQTYPDREVLVVDNGSQDASVETMAREYPWVRVLALPENLGYAGGCNAGIQTARGDILVLLNNDTVPEPGWLAALVTALDEHPDAGSAASRIMLYDRRDTLHSAGDLYRANGIPDSRGVWQPYGPPYDRAAYVFGGCGGAVAIRRDVIEQVGAFDRRFFMYCEDVDLNWRAQLAGWRCIYTPDAVVYHHLSATGGGPLASYYVGRNTLWVLARNYPGALFRRNWRQVLGAQWAVARDALRNWRGLAARARLRGQLAGIVALPRWLWARKRAPQPAASLDYIASILSEEET